MSENLKPLYTRWGKKIDKYLPLNDYPRPQWQRQSWQNLNSCWNYAIVDSEEIPEVYDGEIIVPFSPESLLSGVDRQLLPGQYLYYQREFQLDYQNDIVLLHFGAVDQYCKVYCNGRLLGEHAGGYWPFSFDISAFLKQGKNELLLMVKDDSDQGLEAYGKQKLKRGGIWYTAQSGIWQTVWLEMLPKTHLEEAYLTPLYDEGQLEIKISKTDPTLPVTIRIFEEEQMIVEKVTVDNETVLPIPDFKSWHPDSPFLYRITFEYEEDYVTSYFGMRKFSKGVDKQGKPCFMLNNKPFYQTGLLDQGYWPEGLYTAPSDEAMLWEIRKLKDLGFNMLRKHIKIEPLRWYYHCDREGMLVWQDFVNGGSSYSPLVIQILPFINLQLKDSHYSWFGRNSEEGRDIYYRDLKRTIKLLKNVVSLCVWVPFNEGWGQFDAVKVYKQVREEDGSRLVDHASGWHDQKSGDFHSPHIYFKSFRMKNDSQNRIQILSEFGGYSYPVADHVTAKKPFGYRMYKSSEELSSAYQKLYEKEIYPAVKSGLSATVYTQVSDVEDEVNGIFTYDREVVKIAEKVLRQINSYLKENN